MNSCDRNVNLNMSIRLCRSVHDVLAQASAQALPDVKKILNVFFNLIVKKFMRYQKPSLRAGSHLVSRGQDRVRINQRSSTDQCAIRSSVYQGGPWILSEGSLALGRHIRCWDYSADSTSGRSNCCGR